MVRCKSKIHLAAIINELNKRGYANRQVMTMDFLWFYNSGVRQILWEEINPDGKERTYSYLLDKVVPWLYNQGICKEDIDRYLVDNPYRIFNS